MTEQLREPIDVYWSFRSPYSYLATPDMLSLSTEFAVTVNLRVVLPIAVRDASLLFTPAQRNKVMYILRDWERRAEMLGLPHRYPSPDPVLQDYKTGTVPEDQPFIYRLSCLGVEAQRRGRGPEFAAEVARVIFGGTENWHEGDHLAQATQRAALDLDEMDTAISAPDASHREELEDNQRALGEVGHWGVPTAVLRGEPFFGQDRMDTLRWRLRQIGVPAQ
jgi:2-hydroxychromene-2-carboxylate isomerase